ncbi:MAG: hypothetical protein QM523_03640 [Candidatus Pacebacteria bacterium]|nr:hypothetical protein [Candidatus Paceibacterota bacterium]
MEDGKLIVLLSNEVVRGVPRLPEADTLGKDGIKRHGDGAIALALAYYASDLLPIFGSFAIRL